MKRVLLATAPVALAASAKDSAITKVVQMLGDLKGKVQNDLDAESKAMAEYTEFCDDESTEKAHAIDVAGREIEGFEALIEESTGKLQEYDSAMQTAGSDIAGKNSELASAQGVRDGEAKDFRAAEKELVDTVDMLSRAATVLKRELSFAQGASASQLKSKLGNMITALGAVVDAAWISPEQAKQVQSFLEEDDLSLVQQPQASTKNYESKSGGIVATLNDMQDKAEDQLQAVRKAEMKSKFDFEMLKQSLTDSVANLEKSLDEATGNKGAAEETKAKAEGDLAKTSESKSADQKYRGKLVQECQSKASEWDTRQQSAADEMAALDKAKEVLSSGVKVFAQVATNTHRVHAAGMDSRAELTHLLRKMGRKFNSFALVQMANKAGSDPFVKIRGMVEQMINKLEQQAQEEATHEAFCQEETAKTKKAQASKSERVDKYQTRIDKAKAGSAILEQEIAELNAELADIAKATAEATQIRADENAQYQKASKDFRESAEAVTKAMEVLREFYGGAALIQQPSFGGAKGDAGNSIISFLEVSQSDFTRLLAETEAEESESKEAYKQLMQENQVSKATKAASVKGKTSEVKSLSVAITDTTEDLNNSNTELDAVMDYLAKLKPQCESKAMSYAERKERRDAEAAGLKQALTILSGEEPSLEFMQKKAFLSKA